ncbi:hypothetical protein COCC4DRAFT_59180 [Bipolaris maydis ATCC 48331]|uniref:Carbohydrate-binding module family 50 protein n=2 Tax=Cochliobolus heterostrophus TaxID=5016 RepID=M2TLE7_COCH5|nr:uncharacterized protein COCC4DRAFT_59180 [Bipolaris maydis ATCC 48331]EMD87309.1 carbohydrate-binding module family 50 protein [Bipolaris maydis C5]KAJ5023395.1 hypothetical protein J3E73DRAFT_384756 [Bipolaris maydis]ENI06508.1 hypothetical protein COCC4DRAFT_59180 [Bipolaris maydis ATCC 48331]KAJ6212282.1 carbohydrate-binding module family 50 protein [Bipolaris maydis]KAJ6266813.1 hypothetical protein PSV08DRAFT_365184 [Bipolaris maydis]
MNEPAPTTSSSSSSSTSVAASTSVKPTLSSSSKPVVTTPSTTIKRSTSTTAPPMTTKPSNGVDTPSPLQPSVATNCDSFYYVKSDNSCENIAKFNGISTARFLSWNPSAGSDCTGLWVNAYACISIIGHTPTSVAPMTTTTGNGIATSPSIQYGMVRNCDSFYMVKSGDTCDKISSSNSITSAQLISWNPTVGSSCGSFTFAFLSSDTHPTTTKAPVTTTKPGNGLTTPAPYRTGMKTSCKIFHFVASGETCATISAKYKITTANFAKWNPAVGSTYAGLWASTYACVAVL